MPTYRCPLCSQEVKKEIYDRITGLWKERQRVEAELRQKAKRLLERENTLKEAFAREKKRIAAQQRSRYESRLALQKRRVMEQVRQQRKVLAEERRGLAAEFDKKLAAETKRIAEIQKERLKGEHERLKARFEQSSRRRIEREKKRLQAEKARIARSEKLQVNRYQMLNKQYAALQASSAREVEKRNRKIQSLEEQIKKNQTPQVLGLLEEGNFLAKLKEMFPRDTFEHTGKGGDIVHHVVESGTDVGIIVYELKRVGTFSNAHVEQAFQARQQRKADYGILVTNAKRNAKDTGFSISKGIIVIHPAGALVLVSILRNHIIAISRLRLSKEKRTATVNAVLNYIQSPTFKNGIDGVIQDTVELYNHMKKEVKDHLGSWELRLGKYRSIYSQAQTIETRVVNLIAEGRVPRIEPKELQIRPIELPSEIE